MRQKNTIKARAMSHLLVVVFYYNWSMMGVNLIRLEHKMSLKHLVLQQIFFKKCSSGFQKVMSGQTSKKWICSNRYTIFINYSLGETHYTLRGPTPPQFGVGAYTITILITDQHITVYTQLLFFTSFSHCYIVGSIS